MNGGTPGEGQKLPKAVEAAQVAATEDPSQTALQGLSHRGHLGRLTVIPAVLHLEVHSTVLKVGRGRDLLWHQRPLEGSVAVRHHLGDPLAMVLQVSLLWASQGAVKVQPGRLLCWTAGKHMIPRHLPSRHPWGPPGGSPVGRCPVPHPANRRSRGVAVSRAVQQGLTAGLAHREHHHGQGRGAIHAV